ncbi:hypothetical protein [Pseudomonas sp. UMAB-08]|uniref:hypothetical protein n=1 Tax=Pseudomonas sp. UMAB-08 TaxID=1365375 RepID=UPI00214B42F1|nr:hypothetical protein [Pseudomonas sp. UMAB-08]
MEARQERMPVLRLSRKFHAISKKHHDISNDHESYASGKIAVVSYPKFPVFFAGAISTHRLIYRYRIKGSHVVNAASNVPSHFPSEKGDSEWRSSLYVNNAKLQLS